MTSPPTPDIRARYVQYLTEGPYLQFADWLVEQDMPFPQRFEAGGYETPDEMQEYEEFLSDCFPLWVLPPSHAEWLKDYRESGALPTNRPNG